MADLHCQPQGYGILTAVIYLYSYPGGLKERTATQVHEKDPSEVLRRAVAGMLPKNTLRKVLG